MIEEYDGLELFKPEIFKDVSQNEELLLKRLQDYADFILQQYEINEQYEVVFAKLKNGVLAKCDIDSKQIQLSESEFLKYKENKDILYSFNIPLAIYHEITHAYQCELPRTKGTWLPLNSSPD